VIAPVRILSSEQTVGEALTACESCLEDWRAQRYFEGPAIDAVRAAIAAYRENPAVAAVAAIADCLWTEGMQPQLLRSYPGTWSHIRRSAGPTWNAIATTTRSLVMHGELRLSRDGDQRRVLAGQGSIGVVGDMLWIADHHVLLAQTGLEVTDLATWYGMEHDPDAADFATTPGTFVRWHRRWLERVGGGGEITAGWLSSPRWITALPAHAIHRSRLTDPVGMSLWNLGCRLTAEGPIWVEPAPRQWWQAADLLPRPDELPDAIRRSGAWGGTLNLETLVRRSMSDVSGIPLILAMADPGEPDPVRCWWRLTTLLLEDQIRNWDGIVVQENPLRRRYERALGRAPTADAGEGGAGVRQQAQAQALCWNTESGLVFNGWMLSLVWSGFLPSIFDLGMNALVPPSTLLRAGWYEVLRQRAQPCLYEQNSGHGSTGDGNPSHQLCWLMAPAATRLPQGFLPMSREHLEAWCAQASPLEVGGTSAL